MENETGSEPRQGVTPKQARRHIGWPARLPAILFALILAVGLILILTISVQSGPAPLRVGDVAKQNVRSPNRVSYASQLKTRQAKDAAAANVPDVYDYDPGVAQQQRAQATVLFNGIANIRADTTITTDQKKDRIQRLADGIVTAATTRAILTISDYTWPLVAAESSRVLDEVMRDRVRQTDIVSIKSKLPSRFGQNLSADELPVAVAIVSDLLKPNEIFNSTETLKQKRDAQDKIEPAREVVEKGEIVIREGNVVSALDLEKLEALGLQQAHYDWPDIAGAVLLVLILVGILVTYLRYFQPSVLAGDYRSILLVVSILLMVLAGRLAGSEHVLENVTWVYAVPFALAPMLIGMLIDQQLAVLVAVMLGILAGYTAGSALDVGVMVMLGGVVAALRARHVERLSAFFWAGVIVSVTNIAVVLAFLLPTPDIDSNTLLVVSLMALANGSLAAAITAVVFAPLGNLVGATTVLHLLELAHPSQPLFRRLLLEAPGTYHHSVVISTLAERGAEAVGADTLMARVGAYYHDIGKVCRPYMFIENQVDGTNIHDTLDPKTSAAAILSHVSDGLELARKHRLPKRIQDMIPQHHGTKLVGFFFARAKALGGDVNEADFRYPGPKPQSREAGILMLADGVEAAVRASHDHSQETMERIVTDIVASVVTDGQLDECDLTLRDLSLIRQAFCGVLQGVYHPRIQYPSLAGPAQPPEGSAVPALPLAGLPTPEQAATRLSEAAR